MRSKDFVEISCSAYKADFWCTILVLLNMIEYSLTKLNQYELNFCHEFHLMKQKGNREACNQSTQFNNIGCDIIVNKSCYHRIGTDLGRHIFVCPVYMCCCWMVKPLVLGNQQAEFADGLSFVRKCRLMFQPHAVQD